MMYYMTKEFNTVNLTVALQLTHIKFIICFNQLLITIILNKYLVHCSFLSRCANIILNNNSKILVVIIMC